MILEIKNINAHPFKEFDLFCEQLEERRNTIENFIDKHQTFKMVFTNNDYIIISLGFKKNEKYQRTYFSEDNKPLSHMTFNDIKELLKDNYITEDLKYIQV